jgi:hypothetical protein
MMRISDEYLQQELLELMKTTDKNTWKKAYVSGINLNMTSKDFTGTLDISILSKG